MPGSSHGPECRKDYIGLYDVLAALVGVTVWNVALRRAHMAGAATGNQSGGIYRLFATPCIPKPIGKADSHS